MKNRQFIVIILCICLFWGLWLFFSLQNPTEDIVATDNLSEKEKIDNYFKDKELLYETMFSDIGYNVSIGIYDDTSDWCLRGTSRCDDKEIKIDCKDCKCMELVDNIVPLMVMGISEQVDSLIWRPWYIQVEVNDMYFCEDTVRNPARWEWCWGTKRHAECY